MRLRDNHGIKVLVLPRGEKSVKFFLKANSCSAGQGGSLSNGMQTGFVISTLFRFIKFW